MTTKATMPARPVERKERPILFSGAMVLAILDGRKTQTRRVVKPAPFPDTDEIRYLDEGWAYEAILESETANYRAFVPNPRRGKSFRCPYGAPGDRLWVRETHALVPVTAYRASEGVEQVINPTDEWEACVYREGWERCKPGRWRPSIHMPRWASRITLEITDVQVERLWSITHRDALKEGIGVFGHAEESSALGALAGIAMQSKRHLEMDQVKRLGGLSDFDVSFDADGKVARGTAKAAFAGLWASINGLESWKENPWVWVVTFRRVMPEAEGGRP